MGNFFKLLKENWKSGLTVSLVSLPLSLALAIASGATPTQGIITALWAGFFGALFGGSHYNIIGPTGALSGILVTFALTYGGLLLPIVAILAGIFILLAYFFHLDRYIIFIPRSVVHGFTLGVAFIIGLGQLDNAFGLKDLRKTDSNIENIILIFQNFANFNWPVFILLLVGTIFIFLWNKKIPKFPGAVILAFLGIIFSMLLQKGIISGIELQTLADKYPDLKNEISINFWSDFSWKIFLNKSIWIVALATALIGILETLLSGQIAEVQTQVKFNRSREVFGLGIANMISGLMGGIPATAALARTSLNVKSGATHRSSSKMNSVFLLVITFLLLPYIKFLPMVVIASILVFVSIALVEGKHFIYLMENEKVEFFLSLFTAIITVVEDPIIGILVGTVIALLIFVNNVSKGQTEVLVWKDGKMNEALLKNHFLEKDQVHSDLVVYKISGTLTYINMPAHLEAAGKIKNNKIVIISLRHAFYADSDGVQYLEEIIEVLKHNGNQKIILCGINEIMHQKLKKEHFFQKKLTEGKVYPRTSVAIKDLYTNSI